MMQRRTNMCNGMHNDCVLLGHADVSVKTIKTSGAVKQGSIP